jgi:AhpD family alkylhydroperoxidase
MTTEQQHLTLEQKELVAVGASVGAGCQPCVSHHLKAGAEAGLVGEQLLAAVASAERVNAEAAVAMGDHVRAELGPDVTSPALLSRLEEALASLGAALGANDRTNIERQLRAASELGASRSQLQQAIETAHNVQENAARIHLGAAERLLDATSSTTAGATDAESGAGCGCGAAGETEEPPVATEKPEPVTGVSAGGCEPMAAGSAAGTSGAMAGCHKMFERFMPARADTKKAPTAPATAGPCRKED